MGTHVIAVVGATATGKSGLATALARAVGGEVVNADSMQLYQGMDIGTAKEPAAARQGVPHHLRDIWPVTQTANVADYQKLARAAIDDIIARGHVPVLVGGSGLYVRAALDDLNFMERIVVSAPASSPSWPRWARPHCTPGWPRSTPPRPPPSCPATAAGSCAPSR